MFNPKLLEGRRKNFKHLFGRRKGKLESWRVLALERVLRVRDAGCEVRDVE
jgi:hypothetical protein